MLCRLSNGAAALAFDKLHPHHKHSREKAPLTTIIDVKFDIMADGEAARAIRQAEVDASARCSPECHACCACSGQLRVN
jgi:hypothetical protein